MHIAVVGTGNVGSGLLHELGREAKFDSLSVLARSKDKATAAIMDVASAHPAAAAKMSYATEEALDDADIIVVTAGVQMKSGLGAMDVLAPNAQIAADLFKGRSLKKSAVVICVATPVDYITVCVQRLTGLPVSQVFGFGGDLDRNRLQYVLQQRGISCEDAVLVGEHGGNAIPVYDREEQYKDVAVDVRKFLSNITKRAGETRNIATAHLLGALIDSILGDSGTKHYLCGYSEKDVYLTWPFAIGRAGVLRQFDVVMGSLAAADLTALVQRRVEKCASI